MYMCALPWSDVLCSNCASFTLSALASCRDQQFLLLAVCDCGSIHPPGRSSKLAIVLRIPWRVAGIEIRFAFRQQKKKKKTKRAREFSVWLDSEPLFCFK